MANKSKGMGRVMVNTGLLVAMGVAFGVLTYKGATQIWDMSKNYRPISDAPHLCYDEIEMDDGSRITENSHICSTEYDPETNEAKAVEGATESALFTYDNITFSSVLRSYDLITVLATLGTMLTVGSLVGAVVYFNHNR